MRQRGSFKRLVHADGERGLRCKQARRDGHDAYDRKQGDADGELGIAAQATCKADAGLRRHRDHLGDAPGHDSRTRGSMTR